MSNPAYLKRRASLKKGIHKQLSGEPVARYPYTHARAVAARAGGMVLCEFYCDKPGSHARTHEYAPKHSRHAGIEANVSREDRKDRALYRHDPNAQVLD